MRAGATISQLESSVVRTFLVNSAVPSPGNFEAGTGENSMIPRVVDKYGAGGLYWILGTRGGLSVAGLARWSYEHGEGENAWIMGWANRR